MRDTVVKRLKTAPRTAEPQTGEYHTKQVADRQEAIESKLRLLHGSIFGKPMMKFDIGRVTDVWVPYCYLEYDFRVERNILFKKKGLTKEGKVAVVLDVNEMHPFQYDIYESGQLPLVKGKLDTAKRTVIKTANTLSDMESRAEDYIQFRVYCLKQRVFVYAVEMEIIYKGKYPNMRYAYLDEFAVESEHVLGLKYRVDNNF